MSQDQRGRYHAMIGLEVHAQLLTESKIFCADSTTYGGKPNTQVSPVSLGHPGTLPLLNKKALDLILRMGMACHCSIEREVVFTRKNYFYPDLPKGYQISQFHLPICTGGYITINPGSKQEKRIPVQDIHLEEDSGKSLHADDETDTLMDFNRAGNPLMELVTAPVLTNAEDAGRFLTEVRKMVQFLGICDGNMEEGSLRCDANVSVVPAGTSDLGTKVELKNMNSVRRLRDAIENEIQRQINLLEKGRSVQHETRLFVVETATSVLMRRKEGFDDYRYFPEPDLSPVYISEDWLDAVRRDMPRLPADWFNDLVKKFSLSPYDADVLTGSKALVELFAEASEHTRNYKMLANLIIGPVKSLLKDRKLSPEQINIPPKHVAALVKMIDESQISYSVAAQKILPAMFENPSLSPSGYTDQQDLYQVSDELLIRGLAKKILDNHPREVELYRKGKTGLLGMFMGVLMRETAGKADPRQASDIFKKLLDRS